MVVEKECGCYALQFASLARTFFMFADEIRIKV